jgi:hypothetical protein
LKKEDKILLKILRRTLKSVLIVGISLLLLFFILLGLINIPYIQTKLVAELTDYVSEKINFPIEIERVNISWFDHLQLYNVSVKDPQKYQMIKVNELGVDFELYTLFQNNIINLDRVELHKASVTLVKDAKTRDLNIDSFIKAISNAFASSESSGPSKAVKFEVDEVDLKNSFFRYSDLKKDSISNGFDYNHFSFDSIYADVKDFNIIRDTIEIDIHNLRANESNINFPVHEISTFFRYTKHSMQFHHLLGNVGSSSVKDSLVFEYNDITDLGDFNEKARITANLSESEVYAKDLALFAPDLLQYDDRYIVSGKAKGTVNHLRVKDLEVQFGKMSSTLKGNIRTDGLPDFFETFIELDLKPSIVYSYDLAQYVNEERTNEILNRIGTVSFRGKFLGFPDDFVANGEFFSPVGYVKSDINFKLDTDSLKGSISTTKLALGKITGNNREIQEIDMQGSLEGKGFKLKDASYNLNAKIKRLGLFDYDYRNITTNATLKNQFFEGKLNIKDSNLVMQVLGKIDLREHQEVLNLTASIDTAFLKPLHITPENTIISSHVSINTKGIILDEIVGNATFTNSFIRLNNNEARIDSLYFNSEKGTNHRTFYLWSDPVEIEADGKFQFTSVYEDVSALFYEYYLNFLHNNKLAQKYYFEKRKKVPTNYGVNYQFNFKKINPIVHLFVPDLSISDGVVLKGRFSNGETSILNFSTLIDSIRYKDYSAKDLEIEYSSSKGPFSEDVLADAYIHSRTQQFANLLKTKDFTFEGNWNERQIDFNTFIQERDVENVVSLAGTLNFLPDATDLHFNSSLIKVLNNEWSISPENKIHFLNENIIFKDFSLHNLSQSISIEGELAQTAVVRANNFNLLVLRPLVNKDISGRINGFVNIRDFYRDLVLDSNISLDSLVFDKIHIGDFAINSEWNKLKKVVSSDVKLTRDDKEVLFATGDYNPYSKDSALNIDAKLNQLNLVTLEPFLKENVSNIKGTVTGDINISGRLANPVLNGEGFVKNGSFTINYLQTTYSFNDWIYFTEDGLMVKNLRLRDDENNIAILNGGLYYDSYKNFIVSLQGKLDNFKVLNTTLEDNDLFYGTAMVTGNFEILGAFNNIEMKANARSNKGTKIYIPLGGYSKVEEEDFIRFVNKKDTVDKKIQQKREINLSGIRLNFNLDITPDAMVELIFDAQAGDIIRGYGKGQIKMSIDTKGEFAMFGNYQINRGGYNFTLANLINKEFDILPNSSISWYGDPYKAILDIKAAYEQRVSYAPILNSIATDLKSDPNVRRPFPVVVYLTVRGNLMTPEIGYKIEFKDFPNQIIPKLRPEPISLYLEVQTFQNNIQLNEQELNRQVFSLLILKQLQPQQGTGSLSVSNAGGSVSELLSNQLSYWASQYDENLEIQLNLNGLDADAFNTFQLRVSYSALGGRLRVTREGGFTNLQNQANFASIAGEWTIEYDLTDDGIFRLKLYNRNNYNGYTNISLGQNSSSTTGGLSIMHTQSFNTLKELVNFKRKKYKEEEDEEEEPADDDSESYPQTMNTPTRKEDEKGRTSVTNDLLSGDDD